MPLGTTGNMDSFSILVEEVGGWEGIETGPHSFGGVEFRWGRVEVGHIHRSGMVDIPVPRHIRDELVEAGLAGPHHLLTESGWITTYLRRPEDQNRIVDLFRLSFLQKRVRREADQTLLDELATLRVRLGLKSS